MKRPEPNQKGETRQMLGESAAIGQTYPSPRAAWKAWQPKRARSSRLRQCAKHR